MNLKNFLHEVRTLFLSGLLALLPITLTIAVLGIFFNTVKRLLSPLLMIMPEVLSEIPHIEIFFGVVLIFIVGAILRSFVLNNIVRSIEDLLAQTPLIKPIYANIKQLIRAFNMQDNGGFKQVVLVEFPRKGSYSIGFVTGPFAQEIYRNPDMAVSHHATKEQLYNIFIPATPNPTSGFYIIMPASEFIAIDLTRQEAMALIMSGGIIVPDRFKI